MKAVSADLTGSDLAGSTWYGADMRDANLSNTNLTPDNNTVAVKMAKDSDFQHNAITIIEQLDLQPLQKQFIKSRWLRLVVQLE